MSTVPSSVTRRALRRVMAFVVASFLPVFFLEAREARLFDPLAYSKTFAVAVSTLLTIVLLPIIMVWVFDREPRPTPGLAGPLGLALGDGAATTPSSAGRADPVG